MHDKRQTKKTRDWNREKARYLEKVVNIAYLSIGSNLGDRIINIEKTKNLILFHKMKYFKKFFIL